MGNGIKVHKKEFDELRNIQEVLREDARNKYRNLPEKEKNKKRKYLSKEEIPHEY